VSETYYVWRRSDGYVNATTYMPDDYTAMNGKRWTYELLLKTNEWFPEAYEMIERERG
jgi:hypothetical protein